jgi:hypothetical protein
LLFNGSLPRDRGSKPDIDELYFDLTHSRIIFGDIVVWKYSLIVHLALWASCDQAEIISLLMEISKLFSGNNDFFNYADDCHI